jgi:hypothetical protein
MQTALRLNSLADATPPYGREGLQELMSEHTRAGAYVPRGTVGGRNVSELSIG